MTPAAVAIGALQVVVLVAVAPVVAGMMRTLRSRLEGRQGPSPLQPWRDLRKLLRKERLLTQNASWVFVLAPLVLVASTLTVAAVIPTVATTTLLGDAVDLIGVVYLLLTGTVVLALAGLDTGTAFGGMGSSREMTIAALAEPAALLAIFAVSLRAGSSSLAAIAETTLLDPTGLASPETLLAFGAVAVVTLAESGRLPIDNPSTHLELTMVHEAMILEYAGPDLGLVEFAAQLRLTLFLTLICTLFLPWGMATTATAAAVGIGVAAWLVKVLALGAAVAILEVSLAKLRLFRVPELLAAAFILSFLAVVVSFFLQ
ncbi:MAG: NADH-quinone oxidoreductase subunit H [Acidimicrobiia bacterium]